MRRTAAARWIVLCVASLASVAAQQPPRDAPGPRAAAPVVARSAGTAGISGTVVSDEADSRPLRGAVVTVNGSGLQPARVTATDDDGRFVFHGLPVGNVTLEVVQPGYVSTRYGQKRPGRGAGVVLSLEGGQEMRGLVVRMPHGAAITGTITDEAGRPRPNVQVAVFESRVISGARQLTSVASSVTEEFVRPLSDDRGVYRAYRPAAGRLHRVGVGPGPRSFGWPAWPRHRVLPGNDRRGSGRRGHTCPRRRAPERRCRARIRPDVTRGGPGPRRRRSAGRGRAGDGPSCGIDRGARSINRPDVHAIGQ